MPINLIVEGINDPESSGGQAAPIHVTSAGWTMQRTVTLPPIGDAQPPQVSPTEPGHVLLTKTVDRMTPWLFAAATTEKAFRRISLEFTPDDRTSGVYTKVTLGSAILVSYAMESSTGGVPIETLGIAYRTVDVAVCLRDSEGALGEPLTVSFPLANQG